MLNLKQQLPPLNTLITFEAAARHLSFTLAADELNVTQAAVSRQIKSLEQHLNTSLFIRFNRRLQLTPAAIQLLPNVHNALQLLLKSCHSIGHSTKQNQVTVAATIAFSALKLQAWVSQFQSANPSISVRIIATDRDLDLSKEGVDLAIGCGDYGRDNQLETTLLFDDEVFPVCSPFYLSNTSKLTSAKQLLQHKLLHLDEEHWRQLNWKAIDWAVWFQSQDVTPPAGQIGLMINNYPLLLQAAINGQGVALGWHHLVSDYLATGELIRPIAATLKSQRAYYLVKSNKQPSYAADLLHQWILECSTPH